MYASYYGIKVKASQRGECSRQLEMKLWQAVGAEGWCV